MNIHIEHKYVQSKSSSFNFLITLKLEVTNVWSKEICGENLIVTGMVGIQLPLDA